MRLTLLFSALYANKVPGFLNCEDHSEWDEFRTLSVQLLARMNDPVYSNELYRATDKIIDSTKDQFVHFHRSKSNDFFHACSMKNASGVLCYYGSLVAYLTQYRFYLATCSILDEGDNLYNATAEVKNDALHVIRLIMKNNCLDFIESSSW